MSTTIVTPAPAVEQTPAPVVPATEQAPVTQEPVLNVDGVPAPTHQGNPTQDEARRKLYEKHYGTTAPAEATTEPITTPSVIPTPVPAAPAAVTVPPELLATLQTLQAELAAIKAQTAPAPAPTTESTVAPVEGEAPFIALMREGKFKEAVDALAADVAKLNQAQIVDQAVARAREVARAEADIESFVKDLKAANPELLDMESYVTADAEKRLAVVQASGKIKTTDDAVREYKKAVIDATEAARNTALKIRGQGKTEANIRNQEILSASTLTPNKITPRQETQPATQEPVQESTQSYLEKRMAENAKRQNRML